MGVLSERADQLAVCTHDLGQRVTGHKPPEAEVLEQQAGSLDDVLRVLCGDKRLDLLLGAIKARRAIWRATRRLEEDRVPPFDPAICYGLVVECDTLHEQLQGLGFPARLWVTPGHGHSVVTHIASPPSEGN